MLWSFEFNGNGHHGYHNRNRAVKGLNWENRKIKVFLCKENKFAQFLYYFRLNYGPLFFCHIKISLCNPELSKRILFTLLVNKASVKANKYSNT